MASTAAASLARISAGFSFGYPFFRLPVEIPVVAGFWLPIEAIFGLPVEPVGTILACLAEGAFSFSLVEVALQFPSLDWTFSVLSALLCSLFSLGVCVILPPTVLASAAWPFSRGSLYSFFGGLPGVS